MPRGNPCNREGTHATRRHPPQTSVAHTPQGSTDTFASRLPALRPDWRLELCSFSRLHHPTGNRSLRAVSLSFFCRDLICLKQRNVISAIRQAPRRRTCQFFVSSCISVRLPDLVSLGGAEAKQKSETKMRRVEGAGEKPIPQKNTRFPESRQSNPPRLASQAREPTNDFSSNLL